MDMESSDEDSHTRLLAIASATGVLDSDEEPVELQSPAAVAVLLTPEERAAKLRDAVEFYFGNENFPRDRFLRSIAREHPDRFIPLSTLGKFKRIACLTPDVSIIAAAIAASDIAELSPDGLAVRRRHALPPDAIDAPYRTVRMEPLPPTVTVAWLHTLGSAIGRLAAARLFDPVAAAAHAAAAVSGSLSPGTAALSSSSDSVSALCGCNAGPLYFATKGKASSLVGFLEYEELEATIRACVSLPTHPMARELPLRLHVAVLKQKKRPPRGRAGGGDRPSPPTSASTSRSSPDRLADAERSPAGGASEFQKPPLVRARSWVDPAAPAFAAAGRSPSTQAGPPQAAWAAGAPSVAPPKSASWGHSGGRHPPQHAAGNPWHFTDLAADAAGPSPRRGGSAGKADLQRSASAAGGLAPAPAVAGGPCFSDSGAISVAVAPNASGMVSSPLTTTAMRMPRGPDVQGAPGFSGLGRGRPIVNAQIAQFSVI